MHVRTYVLLFVFFKQKTAYELRISDWSSDVCSSDLQFQHNVHAVGQESCRISNQVGWKIDLLVRFLVHENQHVAFGGKILKIIGLETNEFNGLRGLEPSHVLGLIDQDFHLDLNICATLSRMSLINFTGAQKATLIIKN